MHGGGIILFAKEDIPLKRAFIENYPTKTFFP